MFSLFLTNLTTRNAVYLHSVTISLIFKVNYVFDPTKQISSVYVVQQVKNAVVPGKPTRLASPDTLYISEPIDFKDEYLGRKYNNSFRYVSNISAGKNNAASKIIVCDYEFSFNPKTKDINISNFDVYYHTCIYYQNANIDFFPR